MNEVGESHGGPLSDAEETEIEGGTRLQGWSEETISILTEKRHQLESHIIGTFNGNEMCGSRRRGSN